MSGNFLNCGAKCLNFGAKYLDFGVKPSNHFFCRDKGGEVVV